MGYTRNQSKLCPLAFMLQEMKKESGPITFQVEKIKEKRFLNIIQTTLLATTTMST